MIKDFAWKNRASFGGRNVWTDVICLGSIFLIVSFYFGIYSNDLGFYADDAGFISSYSDMTFRKLMSHILGYVPGRNLHYLWQDIAFYLCGASIDSMTGLHIVQSIMAAVVSCLVFLLARTLTFDALSSWLGAMVFSFYPNHAEAQYWLSAFPMNIMSSFFALIFVITLLQLAKKPLSGEKQSHNFLWVVGLISLECAAFTYDQVNALLIGSSLLFAAFLFLSKAAALWRVLLFPTLSIGNVAAILILKIGQPGNGPGFNHISLQHFWLTLKESVSLNFGPLLLNYVRADQIGYLGSPERRSYFLLIGAMCVVGMGLVWVLFRNKSRISDYGGVKKTLYGVFFAAAFFIMTYFPVYLWYISPRHNYFPSVAVGILVAALSACILWTISKIRSHVLPFVLGGAFVATVLCLVGLLAVSGAVDKKEWINDFMLRKAIYKDIMATEDVSGKAALYIRNDQDAFAGNSRSIFTQEQATAAGIFTGNRFAPELFTRYALPSRSGDFVLINTGQFSVDQFRHIPEGKMLSLGYAFDLNSQRSDTPVARKVPLPTELPYALSPAPQEAAPEQPARFQAVRMQDSPESIVVTIPPVRLEAGEVLTLLPLSDPDKQGAYCLVPVPGETLLCPIDITDGDTNTGHRLVVRFKSLSAPVRGLELGITDKIKYRKKESVKIE